MRPAAYLHRLFIRISKAPCQMITDETCRLYGEPEPSTAHSTRAAITWTTFQSLNKEAVPPT